MFCAIIVTIIINTKSEQGRAGGKCTADAADGEGYPFRAGAQREVFEPQFRISPNPDSTQQIVIRHLTKTQTPLG